MKKKEEIPFVKMHGIGNDYIYVDSLSGEIPSYLREENLPELSRKISDRHFGIGSDGLILILPSEKADFRMRIFNADGSEAKMCGNGIRCVGKYVYDLGFTTKKSLDIETASGIKHLELIEGENGEIDKVVVDMGSPSFLRGEIPARGEISLEMKDEELCVGKEIYKTTGVSMGNPHGVVYVSNVEELNLPLIGPGLERHEIWPDRANIEFVKVVDPGRIEVRVWERGSGETMACGTGACASAVVSYKKGLTGPDVTVSLRGGDLQISYSEKENRVLMTGPASFICRGVYYI
ncbi:MAG: diaminopimelate epimerase [Muribaculaceae bacterium]|nr:diaminopimelate epimerase [Muribaculaceae bacterium]